MTPKLLSISSKYVRWLLPAGLLLILVVGFLQTPEVQTHINPDFVWKYKLYRLDKEEMKVNDKLGQLADSLASLKAGERPGPRQLRQLQKNTISVTNSLHFMDAILANLAGDMQAGLPRAAPARRSELLAYLQKVKTMQLHCRDYHRRLQKFFQRVQRF